MTLAVMPFFAKKPSCAATRTGKAGEPGLIPIFMVVGADGAVVLDAALDDGEVDDVDEVELHAESTKDSTHNDAPATSLHEVPRLPRLVMRLMVRPPL